MSTVDQLMTIERKMPEQSKLALSAFVARNPSYNGAGWADCLDVLIDSDAHLEITEPLYEALADQVTDEQWPYIGLVALTLYYGDQRGAQLPTVKKWIETVTA